MAHLLGEIDTPHPTVFLLRGAATEESLAILTVPPNSDGNRAAKGRKGAKGDRKN